MKAALVLLIAGMATAFAEEHGRSVVMNAAVQEQLSGNLQVDFFGSRELVSAPQLQDQSAPYAQPGQKSPWLAAGLSLVLPGAGEFYAESYWKAALFLAADVAFWAVAYSNDKKGDDQTAFFQGFADEHWSVVSYAEFSLNRHVPENQRARYADLINPNTSLPPWQRVNWALLNQMEDEIGRTADGKYYSHRLPTRPQQQYYELIGKYPQYNQGWDDKLPDNEWVYSETNVTERFKYYSAERGKANDYYSTATTFVTVAIVNHVLSAFDAAWSASRHNKALQATMQFRTIPVGEGYARVPMAGLRYTF